MNVNVFDGTWNDVKASRQMFDVGVWAAGYEERSKWFIERNQDVADVWYRVEFKEDRDVLSAPQTLLVGIGNLLGAAPGARMYDGYWLDVWETMLKVEHKRVGRPLRILIDYSSMPRTVYGSFVIGCQRNPRLVDNATMLYVPGDHAENLDGSRSLNGLRALIGTEGSMRPHGAAAYVIGLGYDGVLAETVVDIFQVTRLSVLYADPGVTDNAVERACEANAEVIARAEFVRTAPAWAVSEALTGIRELCENYWDTHDTVVVPLGPKPHVLGALLACLEEPRVGFRFLRTGRVEPVEVVVPEGKGPFASTLRFG